MKKITCIILIISLFKIAFSQTIFISDSVSIIGSTYFFTSDSTKEKAIFLQNRDNRDRDFLPIYRCRRKVNGNGTIKNINLTKATYSSVDPNILKGIRAISNIGSEPEIKAKVCIERKQAIVDFELMPLRKNPTTGEIEIVNYFECEINIAPTRASSPRSYASTSKMASGRWYKIKVTQSGIYKLTYSQLVEMGFSNFSSIGVFGYGGS